MFQSCPPPRNGARAGEGADRAPNAGLTAMLVRILVAAALVHHAALVCHPALAQVPTAHQVVPNGVADFAFDPPYLIGLPLDGPASLATRPDMAATAPFNHLTVVDRNALHALPNDPQAGYVGLGASRVETALGPAPTNLRARHLLLDLVGDRAPEALIAQPGTTEILVVPGRSLSAAEFGDSPERVGLDRRIVDIAGMPGRGPAVAVLDGRTVQVLVPARPATARPTFPPHRAPVLAPIPDRPRVAGGRRIAAAAMDRGAVVVVAGDGPSGLMLTVFRYTAGTTPTLVETGSVTLTGTAGEAVAALALADLDGDSRPELVLASNADTGTANETGRLRVIRLSAQLLPQLVASSGPLAVAPDRTPPAGTVCGENDGHGTFVRITALRVADIAAAAGRSGPDGRPEIVVAGDLSPDKCDRRLPFVHVTAVGDGLALARLAEAVVWDIPNGTLVGPSAIADFDIGRFNDDALPDVALLDSGNNALILMRQQPAPCVTFITAITHGHQGTSSILAGPANVIPIQSGLETVPPVTYNDAYNADLTNRVAQINAARRTPFADNDLPELCPVAHVAVNGHWEQATVPGAFLHMVGRAGWLLGSAAPSPTCKSPLLLPNPKPTPQSFWLSGFWLLVPQPPLHPRPACIGPLPNYGSRAQFLLAGAGFATELIGRNMSAAASRSAAADLAVALDEAVATARGAMDVCTGKVTLDAVGFSRGTGVTSTAMRSVDMRPLRYNADASLLYLDAIDPSWGPPPDPMPGATWVNGDRIRPWARSGYVVEDPLALSAGSARVSSVFAGIPDPVLPGPLSVLEAPFNPLPPVLSGVNVHRDVIGLPSGYDRSGTLTANGGWFAVAPGLTHVAVRDMMLNGPGGATTSPLVAPAGYVAMNGITPSFANATHLGDFLIEPRRPVAGFAEAGWQRDLPGPPLVPDACQPGGGASGGATGGEATQAPRDELVADPDFYLAHGLVANAVELVALTGRPDSDAKEHALEQLIPETGPDYVRSFLTATAEARLPPGDGFAAWSAPAGCNNCPLVVSGSSESRLTALAGRLSAEFPPATDPSALEAAWAARAAPGGTLDGAWLHLVGLIAAGGSRLDDAVLRFGAQQATIEQILAPPSRAHPRLFLRAGLRFTGPDGTISVGLSGPGLDAEKVLTAAAGGSDAAELSFEVERAAVAGPGDALDRLRLNGRDVEVSWVSIRPEAPLVHPATGQAYELLELRQGIDWDAARALAERRSLDGMSGRLAEFDAADPAAAADILRELGATGPVWLGATGEAGSVGDMAWLSGGPVDGLDPDGSLLAPAEKRAFLLALPGSKLLRSGARAALEGRPIGLLVAYPAP
jgi:hypothetical protein